MATGNMRMVPNRISSRGTDRPNSERMLSMNTTRALVLLAKEEYAFDYSRAPASLLGDDRGFLIMIGGAHS